MRIVAEECIAVGSSVETALPPAMVRPHKTLSLSSTDFHVTRIIEFIVLLHQTPSPHPVRLFLLWLHTLLQNTASSNLQQPVQD